MLVDVQDKQVRSGSLSEGAWALPGWVGDGKKVETVFTNEARTRCVVAAAAAVRYFVMIRSSLSEFSDQVNIFPDTHDQTICRVERSSVWLCATTKHFEEVG